MWKFIISYNEELNRTESLIRRFGDTKLVTADIQSPDVPTIFEDHYLEGIDFYTEKPSEKVLQEILGYFDSAKIYVRQVHTWAADNLIYGDQTIHRLYNQRDTLRYRNILEEKFKQNWIMKYTNEFEYW